MHNFVIGCFNFFRSFLQLLKIIFAFCILMLLFYWIQNITGANWAWLGFIKPFLDGLLDLANSIYSVTFDIFGAKFEFKYFSAVLILTIAIYLMNLFILLANVAEAAYKSAHFVAKKTQEAIFNKGLQDNIKRQEKKITRYSVLIKTKLKKKYAHAELNVNIDEQNKLMNKFITEKTSVRFMMLDGGFLYNFTDFDKVDLVLDVLFKVLHSNAPIDYEICIQSGDDLEQLKKLASLNHFGLVTMAADTAYRYRYNETHRYQTAQVGVFQNGDSTLEVHEFKEIL